MVVVEEAAASPLVIAFTRGNGPCVRDFEVEEIPAAFSSSFKINDAGSHLVKDAITTRSSMVLCHNKLANRSRA